MKIGVFLSTQKQTNGGGFTYEDSILNAILNVENITHEFYIFHYCEIDPSILHFNPLIKFIRLYRAVNNNNSKNMFKRIKNIFKNSAVYEKKKLTLEQSITDNNIDIIWFLSPQYEKTGIPYILTVWDLQHRLQPYFPEVSTTGWTWEQREHYYAKVLPKASYIIIGNKTGQQQIANFYNIPLSRIKTIPLPTPNFVLAPNHENSDVLSKNKINGYYLFFPAQFWPHKNHIRLIKALKILNDEKKVNFSLVLTGSDKGNMDYIKQKALELGINHKIFFLGFVNQNDLIDLYKHAFALVFPSFFGPDNIPPLEAMALKCPVICSTAAGMQEQLGNNALFFNPTDEKELVNNVLTLLEDPNLRDKLINNGYNRAISWTTESYIKGFLSIIEEFKPIRECWSNKGTHISI
ncbi:MAG: hypothetical protein A2X09_15110 [Bacteroidetes bacterium GWF2_43_11]|nr:MAG: hypothetical protein A2X09_15110 [Bacteroidetes bacterium GWF2_43_11]